VFAVYKDMGFDFQFPVDPVVTNETVGVFLNATFFNMT
jgi:hypothetical protein